MPRYSNLSNYHKWKYLGIKAEGYSPLSPENIFESIKRSSKELEKNLTVSLEDINRRSELDLPSPIPLVSPPNSERRKKLKNMDNFNIDDLETSSTGGSNSNG